MEIETHTSEASENTVADKREILLTRSLIGRLGKWAFGASALTMILAGTLFFSGMLSIKTKGELLRWFAHGPLRTTSISLGLLFYFLSFALFHDKPKSGNMLPDILLYIPTSPREWLRAVLIIFYCLLLLFIFYLIPLEIVSELIAVTSIGVKK